MSLCVLVCKCMRTRDLRSVGQSVGRTHLSTHGSLAGPGDGSDDSGNGNSSTLVDRISRFYAQHAPDKVANSQAVRV